jgi:hypothetical protein
MDLGTQYQGSWFIHTDLCLRAGAGWLIPAGTDCQWIECHNIYCVQFDIQYTLGDVFSFLNFICCRNDSARVPIGMRKLPVYVLCVLGCLLCLSCCCCCDCWGHLAIRVEGGQLGSSRDGWTLNRWFPAYSFASLSQHTHTHRSHFTLHFIKEKKTLRLRV